MSDYVKNAISKLLIPFLKKTLKNRGNLSQSMQYALLGKFFLQRNASTPILRIMLSYIQELFLKSFSIRNKR